MAGRVVVVTGASAGIGAALAKKLGANGDRVVLAARSRDALEAVAKGCGPEALAAVADVTRRADVERLRDEAIARFGHVDAWVNNAGRGIGRKVMELTDEDVDEMVSVNLKSALYGMQAIVPHFQARGAGHLVNVSSALSRVPFASVRSAYSASKAALNSLTANLRMDLARSHPGVKVSVVMPGPVATAFHDNALGGTPTPPPGAPPMVFQSADEVADVLVRVLDDRRPDVYTVDGFGEVVKRYFTDIGAFEAGLMGPPRR